MRFPSSDPKPLPWGRLLELTDLRDEASIHPFIGEDLLHVAFSATWFANLQASGIKYPRHAEVSILERVRGNQLREEDGFTVGDFRVEVVVTSEGAYTKAKLRIHVEDDYHLLRMKKLSRYENMKDRLKSYYSKTKPRSDQLKH